MKSIHFFALFLFLIYSMQAYSQDRDKINKTSQDTSLASQQLEMGKKFQKNFQFKQAKEALEKSYLLDSARIETINMLATVMLNLNDRKNAIRYFELAASKDSMDIYSRISLGDIYQKTGFYGSALTNYKQVVSRIDSTNYYALKQMGQCFGATGLIDFSLYYYQMAHRINPNDLSINYRIGNIYNTRKQYSLSISICDEGLALDPQYNQLILLKGYAFFVQDSFQLASDLFQSLLNRGDTSFFGLKYLGFSMYRNQSVFKCRPILEKALTIDSTDYDIYLILADAYNRTNQSETALNLLFRAEKIKFPPSKIQAEIYKGISNVYLTTHQEEKVLDYLKLANETNPEDQDLLFRLACHYDYVKDKKNALLKYNELIEKADTLSHKNIITEAKERVSVLQNTVKKQAAKLPVKH